jgi:hypothetical protein
VSYKGNLRQDLLRVRKVVLVFPTQQLGRGQAPTSEAETIRYAASKTGSAQVSIGLLFHCWKPSSMEFFRLPPSLGSDFSSGY